MFSQFITDVWQGHMLCNNGMTLVEETHSVLHGTKVSYGILVQLLAEGKKDEVEKLVPFYKENNLAIT